MRSDEACDLGSIGNRSVENDFGRAGTGADGIDDFASLPATELLSRALKGLLGLFDATVPFLETAAGGLGSAIAWSASRLRPVIDLRRPALNIQEEFVAPLSGFLGSASALLGELDRDVEREVDCDRGIHDFRRKTLRVLEDDLGFEITKPGCTAPSSSFAAA